MQSLLDRTAEMLASKRTGHLTLARSRGDSIILDIPPGFAGPIVVKLTDRINGAGSALLVSAPKDVGIVRWEVAAREAAA